MTFGSCKDPQKREVHLIVWSGFETRNGVRVSVYKCARCDETFIMDRY